MDNFLSTLSFNQNVLEYVVIFGILALVFGTILVMFWKYIVAGLAAVFCVVVLANHKTPQTTPETTPVKVEQSLTPNEKITEQPVAPVPPVVEVKPQPEAQPLDEHQAYLMDCMRSTGFEYETCDEMWSNRENGLQDARYRKGKNHMMKVARKI